MSDVMDEIRDDVGREVEVDPELLASAREIVETGEPPTVPLFQKRLGVSEGIAFRLYRIVTGEEDAPAPVEDGPEPHLADGPVEGEDEGVVQDPAPESIEAKRARLFSLEVRLERHEKLFEKAIKKAEDARADVNALESAHASLQREVEDLRAVVRPIEEAEADREANPLLNQGNGDGERNTIQPKPAGDEGEDANTEDDGDFETR